MLLCSDMLNLAEFLGLAPVRAKLPAVAYFHESQLTYPTRNEQARDLHFAVTNMTTALAAKAVWFNSAFHRDSFLNALAGVLEAMPDNQPRWAPETIRAKSRVYPQGIDPFPPRGPRRPGPIRICWAARWEHDKGPEEFFEAVGILASRGVDFRLSVLGQHFSEAPPVFDEAREQFAEHIDYWGYQPDRQGYRAVLQDADVFVATAIHEFFGVSAAEAISAGAYPLLPKRLAYPELIQLGDHPERREFLYEGGAKELAGKLVTLAERLCDGGLWGGQGNELAKGAAGFAWDRLAGELDDALAAAVTS